MGMQHIEQAGFWGGGKNYIARGVHAMVRQAEDNKGRVNFWLAVAALVVTIGMNFIPWAYRQIGESAVQVERFEQNKKAQEAQAGQIKTLTDRIEALTTGINELKGQQEELKTKINSRVRARKVVVPQVVKNKPTLSGQASTVAGGDGAPPLRN